MPYLQVKNNTKKVPIQLPKKRKVPKYDERFRDYFKNLNEEDKMDKLYMMKIKDRTKRSKVEKKVVITGRMKLELILKLKQQFSEIRDPNNKEKSKYSFSQEQEQFWKYAIVTCLPAIFPEEELIQELPYLKERLGFKEIYPMLIILAVRKIGKTFFMCLLLLWICYSIPDMEAAIFSTGQNTTTMVLENIRNFIPDLSILHGSNVLINSEKKILVKLHNFWKSISSILGFAVSEIDL